MPQEKRVRLFRNLVAAAFADGHIREEERKSLAWYARRLGVDEGDFVAALALASAGALKVVMPADPQERAWTLETMARVVQSDGHVAPKETQLLLAYGRRMGLDDEELKRCIRDAR